MTQQLVGHIHIEHLCEAQAGSFSNLTSQGLRPYLQHSDSVLSSTGVVRIGAWCARQPVGLLLAQPAGDYAHRLASVMVRSTYRRQGVAKALLQIYAHWAEQHQCTELHAGWSSKLPNESALTALLASSQWCQKIATRVRMTWKADDWSQGFPSRDALLHRFTRQGFQVRAIDDLNLTEQAALIEQGDAQVRMGMAPAWSNPKQWLDPSHALDRKVSVALRNSQGEFLAWLVASLPDHLHRIHIRLVWSVAGASQHNWSLAVIAGFCKQFEAVYGKGGIFCAQPPIGEQEAMSKLINHFDQQVIAKDTLFESRRFLNAAKQVP